ncbi:MAG: phytanoyl-CoA dioxygenase family protein [Bacillota bacterium]
MNKELKAIEFFEKHGYYIYKDAFTKDEINELEKLIFQSSEADFDPLSQVVGAGIAKKKLKVNTLPVGVAQGIAKFKPGEPVGVAQGIAKFKPGEPVGVAQGIAKFKPVEPVGVAQGIAKFKPGEPVGVAQGIAKFKPGEPVGVAQGIAKFKPGEPVGVAQGIAKFKPGEPVGVAQGIAKFKPDEPVGVAQGIAKFKPGEPVGVAQGIAKFKPGEPVGVAQGIAKFKPGEPVGVAQGIAKFKPGEPVGVAQGIAKYPFNNALKITEEQSKRVNEGLNDVWKTNEKFKNYYENPQILSLVSKFLNTDSVKLLSDTVLNKPAYYGAASPLHRDAPFWKGLYPKNQINVWIPLQDTNEENGTLGYVSGSHKNIEQGIQDKPEILQADELELDKKLKEKFKFINLEKGDVLMHHSLTLHGTGPNLTEKPRLAYVVHYTPDDSYVEGNEFFKDLADSPTILKNGRLVEY